MSVQGIGRYRSQRDGQFHRHGVGSVATPTSLYYILSTARSGGTLRTLKG